MATYTPAADIHRPKNGYPADKHTQHSRSRLPVIPDLRFEYSYLRSIRPYIQIERSTSASVSTGVQPVDSALEDQEYERINIPGDEKETEGNARTLILTSEIVHVQWRKVIWITLRDQVISPLLQGSLWALASYYITPFSAQLGSKMGAFAHDHIPTKEGSGVGWLRRWAKNLGLSRSDGDNSYQTQQRRTTLGLL
ncbi:hypothetical protein BYT27DRAFT_7249721 [Phlegmacium glaucopus]|nr:hypothetical protein BYT27DRAFT_7249721 [Phlegmacium glaucopus]